MKTGVYGAPLAALAPVPADAVRFSPFAPQAPTLEGEPEAGFSEFIVAAPGSVLERRYMLAQALRLLEPGASLVALAPKSAGGGRLASELEAFGCAVHETAKAHHRICRCARPDSPVGLDDALAAGGPQVLPDLGLWSQPGVFSWNRIDTGSALLIETLPPLAGRGLDLGCGIGVLSLAALRSEAVTALTLVDADRRAIEAARRNVIDPRARFLHADARDEVVGFELDFALINPPFHAAGDEDRNLGQALARAAAMSLKRGGALWLVANVTLPYERALDGVCTSIRQVARSGGFKVLEGRR